MEPPLSLPRSWARVRTAAIILYSIVILATNIPESVGVPHTIILPYYVVLPGYVLTLVLRQNEGVLRTVFFSIIWSAAILASIYSLTSLAPNFSTIPLNGIIPALSIVLAVYSYYHGR